MASVSERCFALQSLPPIQPSNATQRSKLEQTRIGPISIASNHVQTDGPFDDPNHSPGDKNSPMSRQLGLALPQDLGPNGSRVRKRPSIPRLGDLSNVKIRLWGHDDTTNAVDKRPPGLDRESRTASKPSSPTKLSNKLCTPYVKSVVSPHTTIHSLGENIALIGSSNVSYTSEGSEDNVNPYMTPESTPTPPSRSEATTWEEAATGYARFQRRDKTTGRTSVGRSISEIEEHFWTGNQHQTEDETKSNRREHFNPPESLHTHQSATRSPVQSSIDNAAFLLCKQAFVESTPKAKRYQSSLEFATDTPSRAEWVEPSDLPWSSAKKAALESKSNACKRDTYNLASQASTRVTTTYSPYGPVSVTRDVTVALVELPVSPRRDGSLVLVESTNDDQGARIKAQFKSQVLSSIRDEAPIVDRTTVMATGGVGYLSKEAKLLSIQKKLNSKGLLKDDESREVHIFIDMSNIFIGFQDAAKLSSGLSKSARVRFSPFSFEHLVYILERDRPVAVRRLAGSVRGAYQQLHHPRHFIEAASLGYDCHVLRQVEKIDTGSSFNDKLPMNDAAPMDIPMYWTTTSGDESSDGIGCSPVLCPRTKLGEQGVDENLHLAMQDSLLDAPTPGVMVLATGDAQPAEFSQGFAHYAIKALERGWKIEVVSWRRCLSSEWKKSPFKDKYAQQVRIIELNSFLHELRADWTDISKRG